MFPYHFHHSRGGESEEETTGLTEGEGIANQRESRGEGGYPACAAAVDLWWEANVCLSFATVLAASLSYSSWVGKLA
jgi:hypothetical protein